MWWKHNSWSRIILVMGILTTLAWGVWMLWIRSDGYQIRIMVNNSSSLLAESECRTRTQWSRALALSGRLEEAMSIGLNDTSQTCRQEILNTLVSAFSAFRDIQETEEAEHTNRLITVAAETSLAEAKKSNNNDERYENLKELAVICKHTKVYQISEVAAENALAEVLKFSDTNERYEKLQEFAIVCKRAEFDKISKIAAVNALSHVTAISDLRQRCIELYKFTKVIAKANLIETAEVSAKQVFTLVIELSNSGVLQNSLQNNLKILTAGFTEAGLINIVLDEARKLTDPLLRCCMLTSAASALAKKGNRVEAQNVANEARELLSSFAKGTARSEAYAQVALTYVGEENNSCIDVYTALNLIPNLGKETQSYVRYLAVWELRDASNMKKAIEVTNEITNQYYRAFAYAALIPNIYEDEKDKNTRECIETSIDVTGVIVTDLIRKFIGDSSAALFYRASSNEKRDEEIAKKVRSALKSEVPLSRQFYDLVCSYANHEINPSKKYRLFKHLWSFVESLPEFGIDAGKRALAAARRIQDPEQRRTALMEVCRNFSRLDSVDQAVTVSFNEIDDLNFLYEISIKPLVDDSRVSGKPIGALSPRVNPKVIHRLEELYGNMAERFREDSPHKVAVYLALSRAFFFAGQTGRAAAARGFAFDVARRINNQTSLNQVADIMLEAGEIDKAREIAQLTQNPELKNKIEKAKEPSDKKKVDEEDKDNQMLFDRIRNLAQSGEYREARLIVERLDKNNLRLNGYTEILRVYAKEQYPKPTEIIDETGHY